MRFDLIKKYLIVFILAMGLLVCNSEKMLENEGEFLEYVDTERAYNHIKYLSENIGIRVSGSKIENDVSSYLEKQFKDMGYKVSIQNFNTQLGKSKNIEAIKSPSGKDENDTNEIVYVTAHYDSVEQSPGANDNASGIACMLEIAEIIKDLDVDREIRFVAFGSEEIGLRGSGRYIYKLNDNEIKRSVACFNLDMVASSYEGFDEIRAYTVNGKENVVTDAIYKTREELVRDISEEYLYSDTSDGIINASNSSDHYSFSIAGIPAALIINVNPLTEENAEPYMHTEKDTIDNICFQRLERSIKLIGKAVYDTVNIN